MCNISPSKFKGKTFDDIDDPYLEDEPGHNYQVHESGYAFDVDVLPGPEQREAILGDIEPIRRTIKGLFRLQ